MRSSFFAVIAFFSSALTVFAADSAPSTSTPIQAKLTDIEKRLDSLEKNQEKLLDFQQQILAELERLRVRIRRT